MEGLLSGHAVLFAEKQFSDEIVGYLKEKVEAMGGSLATSREEATILLVNPSHPQHLKEKEHISYLTKTYPKIPQPEVYPYHWLNNCMHAARLVSLEELTFLAPIFTYPAQSCDWRPLRVWVSVNVTREEGESPEAARDSCLAKLEAGGGIAVTKRAVADILVVDETSQFSKKVHSESKVHGRDWQRIVERDWVDGCWRNKKLSWRHINTGNGDDDAGEDSMAEDDTPYQKSKGLGRPAGKPRVEYTPQDDDFLCRWLAAHHPTGSWGSRKTYNSLVDMKNTYPPADRHTPQSWHERYKKNSAVFERRVKRFIQQGINGTLKTKEERTRAKEARDARQMEGAEKANPATSLPEAGPSRASGVSNDGPISSASASVGAVRSAAIEQANRNLVELDAEDESIPLASRETAQQENNGKGEGKVNPAPEESWLAIEENVHQQASATTDTSRLTISGGANVQETVPQVVSRSEVIDAVINSATDTTSARVISVETASTSATTSVAPPLATASSVPLASNVLPSTNAPVIEPSQNATSSTDQAVPQQESILDLLPSRTQLLTSLHADHQSSSYRPKPAEDEVADKTTDTEYNERDLIDHELSLVRDGKEASETHPDSQSQSKTHSETETEMESDSERGEGTQAILADFARAQAQAEGQAEGQVPSEDQNVTQAQSQPQQQAQSQTQSEGQILPPAPISVNVPVAGINHIEEKIQKSPEKSKKHVRIDDEVIIVPAAPEGRDMIDSAKQAIAGPSRVHHSHPSPVDASTQINAASDLTPPAPIETVADVRPREQREPSPVSTPKRDVAAARDASTAQSTPSTPLTSNGDGGHYKRKGRRSLLQDHLLASASKRRRTSENNSKRISLSSSSRRRADEYDDDSSEVDTVYADVSIPPPPARTTPVPQLIPTPARPVREPTPPPQTEAQRIETHDRGKIIALKQAQEYKEKISGLSRKFGMTPSEIVKFMSDLKSRESKAKSRKLTLGATANPESNENGKEREKGKGNYWEDVERGLKERYGSR